MFSVHYGTKTADHVHVQHVRWADRDSRHFP